ncbi:putative nuclease HARBI1 isoform X1 [Rana temporaria]|uniref:putative nuclease HARBI1 isoform X1 n=2 Tax=Rana temporaria TaxID=8407 RepID=UPI001AAC6CD7|nr:putative nuclease HARBI1 isoform X1 [Rana temporaria]
MEPFGCALFELKLIQRRRRTRQNVVQIEKRVFRSRTFLDQFTETQVIAKFRLSSPMIHSLYDEIHLALETRTRRSNAVPGLVRFLAVLHFLGKASYQHVSGEIVGISQPSFSRCLVEVLQALRQLAPKYIHMGKSREERDQIKRGFFDLAGMPNVIGAIDCTHVPLCPPSEQEHIYRNRKAYHSLNIQVICDSNLIIRDVVTGFPGSCHDAHILRQSGIYDTLDKDLENNGWLLGDAGYPCLPWLLTPINRPSSPAEAAYNVAHTKTRVVIERCFGVLKSRFRCMSLSGGFLQYSPSKVADMFLACSILHNIARHGGLQEELDTTVEDDMPTIPVENDHRGNAARSKLITNYFSGNKPP